MNFPEALLDLRNMEGQMSQSAAGGFFDVLFVL